MVLVVIAHVQRDAIDRPVVTERLLIEIISVMLLNPARAHGMQPNGEEKREHEIQETSPPTEIDDRHVVHDRTREIR